MGLRLLPQHSLTTLNAVEVPDGVDDAAVRKRLLHDFDIEVGAGLGPFRGRAWRIGLMGASSTEANVTLLIAALDTILRDQGHAIAPGVGLTAAAAALRNEAVAPTAEGA